MRECPIGSLIDRRVVRVCVVRRVCVCACKEGLCVCARALVFVCVCVRERERGGGGLKVSSGMNTLTVQREAGSKCQAQ